MTLFKSVAQMPCLRRYFLQGFWSHIQTEQNQIILTYFVTHVDRSPPEFTPCLRGLGSKKTPCSLRRSIVKLYTLFKTRDYEYHTGPVQRDMPKKGVPPSGDSSGSNHRTPPPAPPMNDQEPRENSHSHIMSSLKIHHHTLSCQTFAAICHYQLKASRF